MTRSPRTGSPRSGTGREKPPRPAAPASILYDVDNLRDSQGQDPLRQTEPEKPGFGKESPAGSAVETVSVAARRLWIRGVSDRPACSHW